MKVLVTGASGFLGGALVRRLTEEGHQVRIIARSHSNFEEIKDLKLEVLAGDIVNLESLQKACQGMDSVFHLAGLIAYSKEARKDMQLINVDGTANVIKACETQSVRRLVHVSSVAAVGSSFDGKTPLDENSKFNLGELHLGYFDTKRDAELLVKAAADRGTLDAVIVNPSTIYGPADARKGSRETQVKVARGRFPFYTPGGVGVVSYHDVLDALLLAWQKGRRGERYIINGENLLIREVFNQIADCAGVKRPFIYLPRPLIFSVGRVGDVLETLGKKGPLNSETAWTAVLFHWFDASKARRELGLTFRPAAEAIEESVRWMKDNGLLY